MNVAGQALIAADDTNQTVAASRQTCDLLGYQEPDQLIGRRLVAIIPPRYHQAHLAGFTLHLSNGRSPLLGRTVIVPALRRDGIEIMVELMVETHQMPGGRHLFIAQMRPASPSTGDKLALLGRLSPIFRQRLARRVSGLPTVGGLACPGLRSTVGDVPRSPDT